MKDLTKKSCKVRKGIEKSLSENEVSKLLNEIPEWYVKNNKFLKRKFKFKNFKESLEFVNNIGNIAEKEGHHPDILFGWGYVRVELTTHTIKGLSKNDFIVAAKIDQITL